MPVKGIDTSWLPAAVFCYSPPFAPLQAMHDLIATQRGDGGWADIET